MPHRAYEGRTRAGPESDGRALARGPPASPAPIEVRAPTPLLPGAPSPGVRADSILRIARHATALGLGAFLVYCGAALQRSTLGPGQDFLLLLVALAIAVVGAWSIVSMPASRAAALVAALVGGAMPILAFLGWMMASDPASTLEAILWANLFGGVAGAASAGWLAARGPGGVGGAKRTRVARV